MFPCSSASILLIQLSELSCQISSTRGTGFCPCTLGHEKGCIHLKVQKCPFTQGLEPGSAPAILPPPHSAKSAKKQAKRMAHATAVQGPDPGVTLLSSSDQDNPQDAITRPILEAIHASKAAVIVRIDHLATKCPLIGHDQFKIQGRLTVAEDRISKMEDATHL